MQSKLLKFLTLALVAAFAGAAAAWAQPVSEAESESSDAAMKPGKDGMVLVTFSYKPSRRERSTLEEMTLAGEFNNWDPYATPMTYNEDKKVWEVTLELKPGEYLWKFLLNGSWIQSMEEYDKKLSPKPVEYVADPYGGKNAKVVVKLP